MPLVTEGVPREGAPTVSVLAYDGMTAFEAGIVIEVFGLVWPDIDQPWYELKVCTETPDPIRVLGGATLSTPHGLDAFAAADTVVVPSVADPTAPTSAQLIEALGRARPRRPDSSRSAPAPSPWPRPACSTAAARPPTGGTPTCCASASRRSTSTPSRSTPTRGTC